MAERLRYHQAYGIKTFFLAKEQVQTVVTYRLDDVAYVLVLQSCDDKLLITLVEGEKHHSAHTFLKLVDVVDQNLHVLGQTGGVLLCC